MPVHTLSPQFCRELLKHDLGMTLAQRSKKLVRHGSALGDELANSTPLHAIYLVPLPVSVSQRSGRKILARSALTDQMGQRLRVITDRGWELMLALAFPSAYPVPETPAPSPLPLKTYRLQPR